MRISIVGHVGSGKSTLAERISKEFGIPHFQLDRLWFEAAAHKTFKRSPEREEVEQKIKSQVEVLVSQENWVSDGAYFWVQSIIASRTDQIIFLDIPLWRRLWNSIYRTFFTNRHPELTVWDDIKFLPEIIKRTSRHRPKMQALLTEFSDKVIVLKNYRQVDKYLKSLHR